MFTYIIKESETEKKIKGKAYANYKSWHGIYANLIDPVYINNLTLEKFSKIAHSRPTNTIIAKDKHLVIGFVDYGLYRSDEASGYGEYFQFMFLKHIKTKR